MAALKYILCLIFVVASANSMARQLAPFRPLKKDKCRIHNVSDEWQDLNTQWKPIGLCGIFSCDDTFSLYGSNTITLSFCQTPALFQECKENVTDTTMDFPDCCWTCVTFNNKCEPK
ncbi:uncharacterized protein LOC117889705 isoform X2 [Drosophila subobscura]|nr:uncharacterized protein LOC117889705 isoform X2 [Drosophila subobscura]